MHAKALFMDPLNGTSRVLQAPEESGNLYSTIGLKHKSYRGVTDLDDNRF